MGFFFISHLYNASDGGAFQGQIPAKWEGGQTGKPTRKRGAGGNESKENFRKGKGSRGNLANDWNTMSASRGRANIHHLFPNRCNMLCVFVLLMTPLVLRTRASCVANNTTFGGSKQPGMRKATCTLIFQAILCPRDQPAKFSVNSVHKGKTLPPVLHSTVKKKERVNM